jgi:glycosyltransferase involved in cell wall biosynthesis
MGKAPKRGCRVSAPAIRDNRSMLRVAVNAIPLCAPLTGVGQYVRRLMAAIESRGDVEARYFYATRWGRTAIDPPSMASSDPGRPAKRIIPLPRIAARMAQRLVFAGGMRRLRPHLYHEPNYVAMPWDGPLVVTIHDLSFVHHPGTHPKARLEHLSRYLPATLEHASHVITDTKTVRDEVIAHFGLDPGRVTAIHLGVSSDFAPRLEQQTQGVLARYGLAHGGYVLSVGTLEPRKNLSLAIRAWASLPAGVRRERPMVIVGMKGWLSDSIITLVESLERQGAVRFLGYVAQEDLPCIYAGSLTMTYPSRYEGFGLPVVEAMACGVPVITSKASCLPEVAGDAALLVDPDDDDGMAVALRAAIEDEPLRRRLIAAGLRRALSFTWEQCAERTVEIYRAVARA